MQKNNFISLNVDFLGFCSSMLCAIHCAMTPILLSLLPLAGLQFLANPVIEFTLIIISILIASYALFKGYRQFHKDPLPLVIVGYGFLFITLGRFAAAEWQEVFFSSIGAVSVAVSHGINWLKIKQSLNDLMN